MQNLLMTISSNRRHCQGVGVLEYHVRGGAWLQKMSISKNTGKRSVLEYKSAPMPEEVPTENELQNNKKL